MTNQRPASVNNQWINLFGLCCSIGMISYCFKHSLEFNTAIICILLAYALPITLLEVIFLKTLQRSPGLTRWQIPSFERVFAKLVGLCSIFAIIIFFYWLFPEYRNPQYNSYWHFLLKVGPWCLLLAIPYFIIIDARSNDPYDPYWKIGSLICFYPPRKVEGLTQFFLCWIVKAYFLPIMYFSLYNFYTYMFTLDLMSFYHSIPLFYNSLIIWLICIDSLVATIGYMYTFKLFDTHVRSTDSTCFGWVICLICYKPFYSAISTLYYPKIDNFKYMVYSQNQLIQMLLVSLAIISWGIYVLSLINFGVRFSNLTNRGIVTNGLYRYCKHPAYVAKVFFFWITVIPITYNSSDFFKVIFYLIAISLVYYYRAITEERHLSHDPTYVEYALWMNEHSLFAPLARLLPFLKYH